MTRDLFIVGAGGFGREAVWTVKRVNAAAVFIAVGATVADGTPVLKNVAPGATLSPFGTLKA